MTRQPLPRRRAPLPPLPPQRNASTPLQQAHQRPIPLKQPPPQARPAVPSAGSSVGFDHGGAELEHPRSILISRRRAKWGGRARNKSGRKKAEREAAEGLQLQLPLGWDMCASMRAALVATTATASTSPLPPTSTATPHHEFRAHNADAAAAVSGCSNPVSLATLSHPASPGMGAGSGSGSGSGSERGGAGAGTGAAGGGGDAVAFPADLAVARLSGAELARVPAQTGAPWATRAAPSWRDLDTSSCSSCSGKTMFDPAVDAAPWRRREAQGMALRNEFRGSAQHPRESAH